MNIYLKSITYLCFTATFMPDSFASNNIEGTTDRMEISGMTFSQESDTTDLYARRPNFKNPAFPIHSNIEQEYIPNASSAGFASKDLAGLIIRHAQNKNNIPNPNKLTHSAFLFHANPLGLTQKITNLMHASGTELSKYPQYGAEMIYDIREYHPEAAGVNPGLADNCVFCAESDGSAGEVLKGIYPHVHIHPFEQSIETYNGEVSFRPCTVNISPEQSLEVVLKYLGTPYESPLTLGGMIKAINDKNKVAKSDRLFCSEFVAWVYKDLKLLPDDLIPDNVIPEKLSAGAGEYDLLKDFCGQDIKLKHNHRKLFCGCCG